MTSVRTNAPSLAAAQALDKATRDLQATQSRLASGLKVQGAKDNASTFAIAQKMRAEQFGWKAAGDSLSRGGSLLEAASAGMGEVVDQLSALREKVAAYGDPSLDANTRAALKADIQAIISGIDRTARNVEFDGKKPLADRLTPVTTTTTTSSFSVPAAPLTPPSLAGGMQPATGGASQTIVRDGGAVAGRVDLYLDAYSVPDVLEIWQNGVRVAATGQPYAGGGGPVGPGAPVSGQQVLSFDYDPLAGQSLEFRFNENVNASGSVWSVAGVTLQTLASPLPTGTTTTTTVTGTVSVPTTYSYIRTPQGDHADIAARPMTAAALGLEGIDWSDPGPLVAKVDQAIASATDAAAYFGERQNSFAAAQAQNAKLNDALEAGVGKLVDADMGREAATLQAQQLRQTLAAQSLNIANASPHWLLKLFGKT